MIYGNQEVVDKKINALKDLTTDKLITELSVIHISLDRNEANRKNCKSDFSYWSYVAEAEELNAVKDYIEDRIQTYLINNNAKTITKAQAAEERLNIIICKKNEVVNNLNEYKPNGYKRIIEFINKIFSEE